MRIFPKTSNCSFKIALISWSHIVGHVMVYFYWSDIILNVVSRCFSHNNCLLPLSLFHIVLFCLRPLELLFHLLAYTPPEKLSGPLDSTRSSFWACSFTLAKPATPKPMMYPQLNVINLKFTLISLLVVSGSDTLTKGFYILQHHASSSSLEVQHLFLQHY